MEALISPIDKVIYVSGWDTSTTPTTPIYSEVPNSDRVAEVCVNTFPVAEPLFWVQCADDVIADLYYYDNVDQTIKLIPEAPTIPAAENQPISSGAQIL